MATFGSFWLAGFEGSTGFDRSGRWFDHVEATGHAQRAHDDFATIADLGLRGARECVRWPLVETSPGVYDFSSLRPMLRAARDYDITVIWDLFHYGFPRGLDLLSPEFQDRFVGYCWAVARLICEHSQEPPWFTPVNEPSFMAYAAGDQALFAPWLRGQGGAVKRALIEAAISGIDAIRSVCPEARFVNADPVCRVVPPADGTREAEATHFNECLVFEAWDMLSGRVAPELGGSAAHLDVAGINYYWTNQWELGRAACANGVIPPLDSSDPRRLRLSDIVRNVYRRYGCGILISETAHIGDNRVAWIEDVTCEVEALLSEGIPILGVCWYPILGMPEWHEPETWLPLGLWEPANKSKPQVGLEPCMPALNALRRSEERLGLARMAGGVR